MEPSEVQLGRIAEVASEGLRTKFYNRLGLDSGGCDDSPEFVGAVSLLAALEGAIGDCIDQALPFLGMARAELVDYGQRRPAQLRDVDIVDVRGGLRELEDRLTTMLVGSEDIQETMRLEAARSFVRRSILRPVD